MLETIPIATRDARWRKRADEIVAYMTANGRYPRRAAGDRKERALGDWLYNARRSLAGQGIMNLTPERRAYLDERAPEWFVTPRQAGPGTPFRVNADQVARFHQEFGYFPQQAKDADSTEKHLAWFLNATRMADRAGKLPAERAQYLDEVAPGWRGNPRRRKR